MRTGIFTAAVVALAAGLLAAQEPVVPQDSAESPQGPPIFQAGTDVVAVDVSVIDRDGRPVAGLSTEDFTVTVDGEPRRVSSLEFVSQQASPAADRPEEYSSNEEMIGGRLIMIVLDEGNITQGSGRLIAQAVDNFLSHLNRSDRVGLAVIPGPMGRLDFTSHHALVRARLGRVAGLSWTPARNFNVGIAEALEINRGNEMVYREVVERECPNLRDSTARLLCEGDVRTEVGDRALQVQQRTALSMTAMRDLFGRLAKIDGPKTVVLISEGLVIGRDYGSLSWVPTATAAARAAVYAIRLEPNAFEAAAQTISPSVGEDRMLQIDGLDQLTGLARGTVFTVGASADPAFARLAMEMTGYYLLGFEPLPADRDGKTHRIRVDVARRGLTVRARREFAITDAPPETKSDETALTEALQTPLLATDLRVKLTTFNYAEPGSSGLTLLISAAIEATPDNAPITAAGFSLTDEKGRVVSAAVDDEPKFSSDARQVQYYLGATTVDPGEYLLKFAVRDAAARLGSVEHIVKARLTSAGQVRMSDLLLSSSVDEHQGLPRPAVDTAFRTSQMVGYLELYAPGDDRLDRASVNLEIARDPNGPTLLEGPATVSTTKDAGRRIAQGSLDLGMLPPGAYVARAVVAISGKPVGRVTRPLYLTPTAVAAAHATKAVAAAPASAGRGRGGFDPGAFLEPAVVDVFINRLASVDPGAHSAALSSAVTHVRGGRFDEALEELRALEDDRVAVPFLKGLALLSGGNLDEAAASFRQSLRLSADFLAAAAYLGACYAAGGRDVEAVGAWQTSLISEGDVPVIHATLSDALMRLGEADRAVEALEEAVDLFPDDRRFTRRLGFAYAAAGRSDEALEALDRHLRSEAGDQEALFLAMRVIYERHTREDAAPVDAGELEQFERYARAYAGANGPQVQIVAQWQQYLEDQRP